MLEKYRQFKKILSHPDEYYEKNSIGDEPLFGSKDFYTNEYLNNEYKISVTQLNKFKSELNELILKYKYILGYLSDEEQRLIKENQLLDKEFFELNKQSTKGQSFLKMFKMPDNYNHVVDFEIAYAKNITNINDIFIKSESSMEEVNFYIDYINDSSFFLIFDKATKINDIFIDFYNELTFSMFGVKRNGEMEAIKIDINSKDKIHINEKETLYKKIYLTSISDISKLLKSIKVFSYTDNIKNKKNGFLTYKLNDMSKNKEYIVVSDDKVKIFAFDEQTYKLMLSELISNENNCIEKFFNEQYEINKNENIINNGLPEIYIMEFFNKNQTKSNEFRFFAKEG